MKDIQAQRGRHYIASLVAEGEHEHQDFKFTISDAHKIAHSVSAFANAGGGSLLIGVKDNGVMAGVRNEEDIYVVEHAAHSLCEPPVDVEFTAYRIDDHSIIIKATIPQAPTRPVRCREADGSWRAYCRVADENIVAHPLMVRAWQMDAPVSFCLDSTSAGLLQWLDSRPDGVEATEIALQLGISQRRADNLIVSLAAAGVLSFVYRAPHFLIARTMNE
ncbi:MAG: ATP-binding protein [Muribaculaceae bacterium]|nr:ATP-binding protein [Muribaculaceae bacterium]